jgi:HEAT repeat protein
LKTLHYIVRKNAVRSLGQIGGATAEKAIGRAVADSNQLVSKMALEALEKIRAVSPHHNLRMPAVKLERVRR